MIVVMASNATEEQLKAVTEKIIELGYKPHTIRGVERTVIGAVGHEDKTPLYVLEQMPGVESVIPILKPWKLVGREFKPEPTVIEVDGEKIGGEKITVIAGPCSVESEEQVIAVAESVKSAGAAFLRGGAFKPRTSPYSFQGLGEEGLQMLKKAKEVTGLKIVTEVLSVTDIPLIAEYADIIQVGARNAQNYALLNQLGKIDKPVLIKRGMATTIKEYLMAAEYIVSQGNYNVILCERGIRTFEDSTRFTLDLSAVPLLKKYSHLPVFVDPSHGTGYWYLVSPMAKAAIAAGADGLMIEVHPNPKEALSDGMQSLKPEKFAVLMEELRAIATAVGRTL
ncbi:3-deoxy-7-phosphoheptulonate synthase [Candidatus Sumerlaeota bacterium]|nr:3-deoxy-7-phosphoheptulonate synthase [Candidatus Sumerlaeota bacterium]